MNQSTDNELEDIFKTLNGSGAHACHCPRSTDNGCKCALKDEYLKVALIALRQREERLCNEARAEERLLNQAHMSSIFRPGIIEVNPKSHNYIDFTPKEPNNE